MLKEPHTKVSFKEPDTEQKAGPARTELSQAVPNLLYGAKFPLVCNKKLLSKHLCTQSLVLQRRLPNAPLHDPLLSLYLLPINLCWKQAVPSHASRTTGSFHYT